MTAQELYLVMQRYNLAQRSGKTGEAAPVQVEVKHFLPGGAEHTVSGDLVNLRFTVGADGAAVMVLEALEA